MSAAQDRTDSPNPQSSGSAMGYKTAGTNPIPVDDDEHVDGNGILADAEDAEPIDANANSDAQLQHDDAEAIDKDNIINERTRNAAKPSGTYAEPGDEEVSSFV
jgi:hypothetical protein